ncbi:MAG: CRISPR-associated endonuclease Cas1 [Planctomycetes bacterium]|nr:CRISPR-associated endonuclease Cas1 [Planctomycetota bacterium]
MERTLYLNENTTLNVIRDGPSLVVKEDGKSDRRVPARLVQQVIITGNIKLETSLITLFTQNNVPVTFFDKKGCQIAVTLPYRHYLPGYYKEQRIFFESDYTIQRFMTFLRAYRQRIQIDVLKLLLKKQMPDHYITVGLKEEEYQQVIDNETSPYRETYQPIHNAVSALFVEMVISKLIASGLDPHLGVMHRRRDLGLALDICHILGPEIDIQSIQFFYGEKGVDHRNNNEISSEDRKAIAVRFENRKGVLVTLIEHITDGMFELIRELRLSGEFGQYAL